MSPGLKLNLSILPLFFLFGLHRLLVCSPTGPLLFLPLPLPAQGYLGCDYKHKSVKLT